MERARLATLQTRAISHQHEKSASISIGKKGADEIAIGFVKEATWDHENSSAGPACRARPPPSFPEPLRAAAAGNSGERQTPMGIRSAPAPGSGAAAACRHWRATSSGVMMRMVVRPGTAKPRDTWATRKVPGDGQRSQTLDRQ